MTAKKKTFFPQSHRAINKIFNLGFAFRAQRFYQNFYSFSGWKTKRQVKKKKLAKKFCRQNEVITDKQFRWTQSVRYF